MNLFGDSVLPSSGTLSTTARITRTMKMCGAAVRIILLVLLLRLIAGLITLGTSPDLLACGLGFGVAMGTIVVGTNLTPRGVLSLYFLGGLGLYWLLGLLGVAPFFSDASSLQGYVLAEHLRLIEFAFLFAGVTTYAACRYRLYALLEVVATFLFLLTILSPHRGFHLDQPKFINLLAWHWAVDPIVALLTLGAIIVLLSLASLYLNSSILAQSELRRLTTKPRARNLLTATVSVIAFLGALYAISWQLYGAFSYQAAKVVSNGVGTASEQGNSPLNFESALGGSAHPAGIVRLENEYIGNPFSPMLYMREQALSELKGFELVNAPNGFDTDVPRITVGQSFSREIPAESHDRREISTAVFLIGQQNTPFAIDFPFKITPLRPPDKRFSGAYRAVSLAPTYELKRLVGLPVGDPEWTAEQWQHYLRQNPDPRYFDKATALTRGLTDPLAKAVGLLQYLSKESTYTLNPMHDTKPGEDPTAPYLFGDMRGYCVHFAHATVFMLRALGIPARIATGFMSDLSQAKDGHILLRMSDRHAWAEVFVRGLGWVPFDIQPQNVESHADTQVDQEILEELMGLLGPGEEILPENVAETEPGLTPRPDISGLIHQALWPVAMSLILVFVTAKGILWYAWYFVRSPRNRLRWSYRAIIARCADLGLGRDSGETRTEHGLRLLSALTKENRTLELVTPLLQGIYGDQSLPNESSLHSSLNKDLRVIRSLPWWRRVIAFCNPRSLVAFLTGDLS